jgi:long-chain acyl-CoA synthetase
MGALSNPDTWEYGYTGGMETCVECKLVDVPDLGYYVTNEPPQGEVLLRGPSITSGYLNRPEETASLFDENGWLKTGDIGQFDTRGCLKIIDRVKNLVKTLNGEYIALEKVFPIFEISPDNSLKQRIIRVTSFCQSVFMRIQIGINRSLSSFPRKQP